MIPLFTIQSYNFSIQSYNYQSVNIGMIGLGDIKGLGDFDQCKQVKVSNHFLP